MSRLDIKTASKAQTVVDRLYKDMERRIASSPPGLCPIDMSLTFLQLCHAQSCGKCVPCRMGLGQLAALMGQVLDGTGTMLTIDTIEKTARAIVASADCAIGRDAAQLVLSGFEGFRDDYAVRSQFPSLSHLFGTDNFGRDILTRIMVGGRYTLFIALVCVTSSAIIGSLLGLIAAYYPKVDNIIMRIIDIFMGIPTMMLCVSIVAALGSSMRNMMIALIVTQSPEFARIMRAQVLTVKDKEYIEAARSIGCSNARIIF